MKIFINCILIFSFLTVGFLSYNNYKEYQIYYIISYIDENNLKVNIKCNKYLKEEKKGFVCSNINYGGVNSFVKFPNNVKYKIISKIN